MSNAQTIAEPTVTPVISLNARQQALHFWELSTLVRRGWKNPETNRWNKLSGEKMLQRITYYLTRFDWNEKMLARISELHEIAYKTLRGENGHQQTDSGKLRATSK